MTTKRYYLLTICVLSVLLGATIAPVFALTQVGGNKEEIEALNKEIEERKQKVKQIESSISSYKDRIAEKRTEAVSLSNQISLLDNKVVQIELDIEATEEKIQTLLLEIRQLELTISEKERVINRQKLMIAEFLRTLHQYDGKDLIEVMAAYDDFSDFYNRVQYLERLERDIANSVQSLKIASVELQEKKAQTKVRQGTYEVLREELEEKKVDIEEQTFLKSDLLAQTQSSELQYKTLVANLRSQYESIESEISGIEREVRQKIAEEERNNSSLFSNEDKQGLLSWPTPSRYITARFRDPSYPYRHVFEHNAIDIRAGQGTPLKAAASGYVARARHCSSASCYSFIMLVHSGGMSTVYGHMSQINVKEDQFVARGDVIGLSGGTPGTVGAGPFVTGPHLHFEVRKDGIPVNPLSYLIKDW